jgi:hypothetical protein
MLEIRSKASAWKNPISGKLKTSGMTKFQIHIKGRANTRDTIRNIAAPTAIAIKYCI